MNQAVPSLALEIRGLAKSFEQPAVDGLDLRVRTGEFYTLLGPNGAGKTTTLRMVTGLLKPDRGSIAVFGIDALADPAGAKQIMAWLSDEPMIYDKLTPMEYLHFVAGLWAVETNVAEVRAHDLIRWLGLETHAHDRCEGLSRGMRQKVALAGALVHEPRLIILDEPFTGLDAGSARLVKSVLRERVRAGCSVVMTTHILDVAERMADRIAVMVAGRLLAEGNMDELRRQTGAGDSLEDIFLALVETGFLALVETGAADRTGRRVRRGGTIFWFAHHEWRLAWRDWLWLMSRRRRSRRRLALGLIAIALFLHGFAYLALYQSADLSRPPDKRMLLMLSGALALYGSLMLSQAMEAVTRAFYGRGDLDLILSSPVATWRLFAVRIVAIAATIAVMSLALAAPFINILTWFGGLRWLAAYGVIVALAMVAVAVAVVLTVGLFRTIGPKHTRLGAQIAAAVIGASFVIGVQLAAILSYGTPSRVVFLQSETVIRFTPDSGSVLWLPARAILGDLLALLLVFSISAILLAATICVFAPRTGQLVLAAAGVSRNPIRQRLRSSGFRETWPTRALRHKEWHLLRRDPWLMSQSMMQLLYLLPPAFLLWRDFL